MIEVREWPKGHRLFSDGDFHLSFDPPVEGGEMPAIFMKIRPPDVVEILAVGVFKSDADALDWFRSESNRCATGSI